jgi:hypothetical protein
MAELAADKMTKVMIATRRRRPGVGGCMVLRARRLPEYTIAGSGFDVA